MSRAAVNAHGYSAGEKGKGRGEELNSEVTISHT